MNNLTDTSAYSIGTNNVYNETQVISKETWVASLDANSNSAWQALHIDVYKKPNFDDLTFVDATPPMLDTQTKKLSVVARIFLALQILFTIFS